MEFTVLMSVYAKDNPDYFTVALNSVTSDQTLKPQQIVVVFDGTVPKRIEIITKEVSQKNPTIEFTIVKQKENRGLASALNIGLKYCKNEYIARMDADDYAVPDRFFKQISFLEKNKDIDVLGGTIAEFADDIHNVERIREVGHSYDEILKMAKHRTPFNHMTVIYKKSKVLKVGGYNENYGKLEDYKLWVDLIAIGCNMANMRDVLVHMRVGNGLIDRRSDKREIRDWDCLQKDLIKSRVINNADALFNRLYIRIFTYMPSEIKKIAYLLLLRKGI